jgi:hypothetical protein
MDMTHSLVQVLPGPEELGPELDCRGHNSNPLRLVARLRHFGDIRILYPLDPSCRIAGYEDTRSSIHLGYVEELEGVYPRAMPCKCHTMSSLGGKLSRVVKIESLADYAVHQEAKGNLKTTIVLRNGQGQKRVTKTKQ